MNEQQTKRKVEKKCWPQYFHALLDGRKNFELRIHDFEIAEGDTLVLREWDPAINDYTGRELERTVTYVAHYSLEDLARFNSLEEVQEKGLQVISLK